MIYIDASFTNLACFINKSNPVQPNQTKSNSRSNPLNPFPPAPLAGLVTHKGLSDPLSSSAGPINQVQSVQVSLVLQLMR